MVKGHALSFRPGGVKNRWSQFRTDERQQPVVILDHGGMPQVEIVVAPQCFCRPQQRCGRLQIASHAGEPARIRAALHDTCEVALPVIDRARLAYRGQHTWPISLAQSGSGDEDQVVGQLARIPQHARVRHYLLELCAGFPIIAAVTRQRSQQEMLLDRVVNFTQCAQPCHNVAEMATGLLMSPEEV